jgi:hypothetical protein
MTLPERADDLELELRRLPSVVAVGLSTAADRLIIELALADGCSEAQIASVRERAELLARGSADEVTVRAAHLRVADAARPEQ